MQRREAAGALEAVEAGDPGGAASVVGQRCQPAERSVGHCAVGAESQRASHSCGGHAVGEHCHVGLLGPRVHGAGERVELGDVADAVEAHNGVAEPGSASRPRSPL